MSRFILSRLLFLALLLGVIGLVSYGIPQAMASKSNLVSINGPAVSAPLTIPLGKAEVISLEGAVSDIMVADPSVVDVVALKSNRLYLSGLQVGDTNLIVLDANGDVLKKIDVHVSYDLKAIQALVSELFPKETIKVASIHDQILLTGTVSNSAVASKVTNIVGHYVGDLQDGDQAPDELISNLLEVRGKQQVTLQVRIIEAQRSVLKELGVQTNSNDPNELATSNVFGVNPFSSTTNGGSAAGVVAGAGLAAANPAAASLRLFKDSGLDALGTVGVFVNALEEQNLINVLAEPNLTTVSGEQAGFLAGGETPVPSGLDQLGNIVVEFRQFGVSLNFMPLVLSEDRISLQMSTEVSSINFENAIPTGTIQVPGFDVRRAETTVELPSGGSIMIAGILQSEAVEGMQGLPGISRTPVLGDLLKSDSFQREETELVVIVTPYLVDAYKEQDRPAPIPGKRNNPLANHFADNLRRVFDVSGSDLFGRDTRFGYLLD